MAVGRGPLAPGIVALLLVLTVSACNDEPSVIVRPADASTPTPTATSTSTPTPTASATPTATPTETPIPGTAVTSVKELVDKYGWPAGSDFARIRIPTIGVDAQVGTRVVGRDAIMQNPAGPADVVWYDLSQWDGLGGAPGAGRNAIFSGHVDYAANVPYADVAYRGQGVFSQLRLLSQGDIIEIDYKGETLKYKVVSREQLGLTADWAGIWSSKVATDTITLYTCGGAFDFRTAEYADRVVVRAERI